MSVVQSIDWVAIAPAVVVALGALLVLLVDLLAPRRDVVPLVTLVVLIGAAAWLPWLRDDERATFCIDDQGCSYVVDDFTLVLQAVVLLGTAVMVLLSAHAVREESMPTGEYHFLLLSSVAGAVTLAAARDLVTVLVALEVVSLPAFALVALRRTDGRGAEAALKVFLVSVVASAVSLYGISLVYGTTGTVFLDRLATELADPDLRLPVTSVGVVLVLAAFAFKVAAVPFHAWAPDTYEGAPIPVAAYLSVVSKAAGFAGLLLVVTRGFGPYADVWSPTIAVVAALTMTVGNVVALRQRSAVRLLAWSSIAQAGYMLVPLGALGARVGDDAATDAAVSATVAYVAVYAAMNLCAFGVVAAVGRAHRSNQVDDYRGLARQQPLLGVALAFALACLAGLPPGLIGLFAKIRVFEIPVDDGLVWLAIVMAVNTVVALYYYLSWAALLVAGEPSAAPAVRPGRPPAALLAAVCVTLAATVVLSVAPGLVLGVLT